MLTGKGTATTTFQTLAAILQADGLNAYVGGATTAQSGYLKNTDTAINLYVGTGSSSPSTYITIAPTEAILVSVSTNLNEVWVKSASSTVVVNSGDGAVYQKSGITGVIGTITGTANTIPKYSSGNLVDSSIVDNGTIVAISEPIAGTGYIKSSGLTGVGYAVGAGAAASQGTSRTTGVTVNAPSGAITLFSAAGSATPASFTVTNSAVVATDTIIVNQKSGTDLYEIFVTAVGAGSFRITSFTTGGTTTETPVFNFSILKGIAS